MAKKKIKGVLISIKKNGTNEVSVVEVQDDLQAYYDILNCDCIDITERSINGNYYDIVCDDEGLLKNDFQVTAINYSGDIVLVGNLFICSHTNEGKMKSLNEKSIQSILDNIVGVTGFFNSTLYDNTKVLLLD